MASSTFKWALGSLLAIGCVTISTAFAAIRTSHSDHVPMVSGAEVSAVGVPAVEALTAEASLPKVSRTEQPVVVTVNTMVAAADPLLEKIEAAKANYQPMSDAVIDTRKARLRSAIRNVNSTLARSPRNAAGWKTYLMWDKLSEQMQADAKLDLRTLNTIRQRMYVDENGLEMTQFTALREALTNYMNAAYFQAMTDTEQTYKSQLDKLAMSVQAVNDDNDEEAALAIGRIAGWLDRFDQAPALVRDVQNRYWTTNLKASISEKMAAKGFSDSVDQVSSITDNILGTSIRATVHTRGQFGIDFRPSSQSASIGIKLTGNASSNSVGRNGPVTIYSTGNTSINANAALRFDGKRLSAAPATASCDTDNTVNCIGHRSKLVQKMAWKRVRKSECEAEAIASCRAEKRVSEQMNQQVAELVAESNANLKKKVKNPLIRKDALPRRMSASTTSNRLELSVMQANTFQVGALTEAPDLTGDHDLSVQAHASSINNLAESLLGGVKLTDERMGKMAKEMTGKVPPALQAGPEDDPWSITFAGELPVSVKFDDSKMTISVRGRRFTRGDQEIKSAMTISATYAVSRTETGSRLVREGDVVAEYENVRGQQSVGQVAFKTFIRKKFEGFFKDEFASDGIELPGKLEKVGKLQLSQLDVTNGWLVLGWNMSSPSSTVATVRAAPVRVAEVSVAKVQ